MIDLKTCEPGDLIHVRSRVYVHLDHGRFVYEAGSTMFVISNDVESSSEGGEMRTVLYIDDDGDVLRLKVTFEDNDGEYTTYNSPLARVTDLIS